MFNTLTFAAISALMASAMATPPALQPEAEPAKLDHPPAMFLTAASPPAVTTLCKAGETTLFSAAVLDDLGYDISLCVEPADQAELAMIHLRSAGEGGPNAVSCQAKDCAGKLGMQHYRRAGFSMLTLEWVDPFGGRQKITESFTAQTADAPARHSITHHWSTAEMIAGSIEPATFEVEAHTDQLSMLRLEQYLPSADWPATALPAIAYETPEPGIVFQSSGAMLPGEAGIGYQRIEFGMDAAKVLAAVGQEFGGALGQDDAPECPAGPMHIAQFDGFSLAFQNDVWVGWFASEQPENARTVRTEGGFAPGSTNLDLPEVAERFPDSTLGEEFRLDGMQGLIDTHNGERQIVGRWSGINCIFR